MLKRSCLFYVHFLIESILKRFVCYCQSCDSNFLLQGVHLQASNFGFDSVSMEFVDAHRLSKFFSFDLAALGSRTFSSNGSFFWLHVQYDN